MIGMAAVQTRRGASWRSLGLVMALAALGACDSNDDVNLVGPPTPASAVVTLKDSSFNFSTLHTFAMPDTVVQFAPLTGAALPVPRTFDATILNRVRADFIARGYVQVTGSAASTADFIVLVGATATTNYNAWVGYSWFSVWGFFPGWSFFTGFDNSWTIVYPWYPVVGVTAYDRGTLIVDLIPTKSVNPTTRSIRSAWAGVATAILAGQVTSNSLTAAIDEMFRQSPYLTAGQ